MMRRKDRHTTSRKGNVCTLGRLLLCSSLPTGWGWMWCLLFSTLVASCAKMGAPDGGWFDEKPPTVLRAVPADGALNVNSKKVTIYFDEYIQLDNPSEKVVVSPPQLEQAEIKSSGKRIIVELLDSLKANTTYTIDFSDAITDNNESNPMGNYTYMFSTGDHIDTLQVAGYVLEASNLEPVKGLLVGLYALDDDAVPGNEAFKATDTLFLKTPMLRVSRTNSLGHFVVKGVAPGRYRVFALQDMDGNYTFTQKAEKIAYNREVIVPTCKPDIRQDTIWRDSLHISNIEQVSYTHFLPDDLVLSAFQETQTDRYFLKADRQQADNFKVYFSYGNAELPKVKGLNFNADDAFIVEPSVNQDTITYWLRDTTLVNKDTLNIELRYLTTDSTGVLQQQTDTLEILSRQPYAKRLKQQREAAEKWKKQQERNKKRGKAYEEVMPPEALEPDYKVPSAIDPNQVLLFSMKTPLQVADTAAIHLYTRIDSLWYRSKFIFGEQPGHMRTYQFIADWKPGGEYSLEIDSAAFVDIYGRASKPYKQGIRVMSTDEYSTLIMTINGMDDQPLVVQLLNGSDGVVKEAVARQKVVTIPYIKPGTYYVRLFVDRNNNGVWDTGNYDADEQPEAVYYYPEKVECRAKWDVKKTWSPLSVPLYRQKPSVLIKQKAETKKTTRSRNIERAREMGIDYYSR